MADFFFGSLTAIPIKESKTRTLKTVLIFRRRVYPSHENNYYYPRWNAKSFSPKTLIRIPFSTCFFGLFLFSGKVHFVYYIFVKDTGWLESEGEKNSRNLIIIFCLLKMLLNKELWRYCLYLRVKGLAGVENYM